PCRTHPFDGTDEHEEEEKTHGFGTTHRRSAAGGFGVGPLASPAPTRPLAAAAGGARSRADSHRSGSTVGFTRHCVWYADGPAREHCGPFLHLPPHFLPCFCEQRGGTSTARRGRGGDRLDNRHGDLS